LFVLHLEVDVVGTLLLNASPLLELTSYRRQLITVND